ncbi:MAG: Rrf2 family transcriptional regulator [Lewinellaceae bacterium]|nr:Rrf2 family transcriptional regulator [Saprospiraceae bacterium]MCB9339960.1 Rrf2 family transcriptional regulator [Lewinellaceae bacterium]
MFSKSCQYAIRATIYLAMHQEEGKNLGVKEIATSLDVPQQFLAKILQQLSRQNLVSSIKGPNGGFYLSPENKLNSLLQIIECIDGPLTLNSCVLGLPQCSSVTPCPLHFNFFEYREKMRQTLGATSISNFSNPGLPPYPTY